MIRTLRGWAAGAVLALSTTAAGCAGAGWEDVLNGGRPGGYGYETEIRGEVRGVGARTIDLRTDRGRNERIRYDGRTDVRYRDQRYSVRNLRRGDYVAVRIDDRGRGDPYARWVTVRRSQYAERVYDRRRDDGRDRAPGRRTETSARTSLEGRVGRVDRDGTRFELRGTRAGTVWVSVPRNASRGTRDRVVRLREGQQVRLQGRFLSGDRFEVEGFR
jgi:hypothetical protein